MRRIYISMIVTALLALFLSGWFLDHIFDANSDSLPRDELSHYSNMLDGVAHQLAPLSEPEQQELVEELSTLYSLEFSLVSPENLALPMNLQDQMNKKGGLKLASDSNPFLVKQVSADTENLLMLTLPRISEDDQELSLLLTILLYGSFALILMLWLLPLTKRLSLLTQMSHKFGQGELDARVPPSRFSYITKLETSYNRMADQIEKLIAENKFLSAGLSHDLRTPLACLRFGLDAVIDCRDDKKREGYLDRMEEELTRMETMLEAFLSYARMERQGTQLNLSRVDCRLFVESVFNECQPIAQKNDLTFELHCDLKNEFMEVDPGWFHRALANLITNAISHAKSTVSVSCIKKNQRVHFIIEDDGAGIPEDQRGEVFKPFVKLEKSRTRKEGNFGLGLAIVSRVVKWHHAQINVFESKALKGACFIISMKLS